MTFNPLKFLIASCLSFATSATAQDQVLFEGTLYEITGGAVFEVDGEDRRFVMDLYDPMHIAQNYSIIDGVAHRIDPSDGTAYPTLSRLETGFENSTDILAQIGPGAGWTALTLRSPAAPTVPDYVALWQSMVAGETGCLDNCVALALVDGNTVLHTTAVAPSRAAEVSKASLDTGLLYLEAGDSFRFSADVFIADGMPVSLVDFEASYMRDGPGLRVMFTEDGVPWVELKFGERVRWIPAEATPVPQGAWFSIAFEADLDRHDGAVRLWLNDRLIVDAPGQTLPLADAVYDRMEMGITAALVGPTTLLIDNVAFAEIE